VQLQLQQQLYSPFNMAQLCASVAVKLMDRDQLGAYGVACATRPLTPSLCQQTYTWPQVQLFVAMLAALSKQQVAARTINSSK
jgi:hypothetical protein